MPTTRQMASKVTKVTPAVICAGAFSTGAGRFVQGAIRLRGDAETCIGVRRIGVIGLIGCKVRHGRCSGSPYLLRAGGRVPTARRNVSKVTKVTLVAICGGAVATGAGRFVQGAIGMRRDAETCIGVRRIGMIGPTDTRCGMAVAAAVHSFCV